MKKLCKLGIVHNETGFTLVEAVISIALIGIIGAALYMGLGTASTVLLNTDARETAKNLAETQMEYIKSQNYVSGSGSEVYVKAPIPPEQSGYVASIEVKTGSDVNSFNPVRDDNLQKIIVTVSGAGITYSLEGYKTK